MKKQGKKGIKKVSRTIRIALLFVIALLFAVIFVLPTVITISNSFMTQSEINANYGKVFEKLRYNLFQKHFGIVVTVVAVVFTIVIVLIKLSRNFIRKMRQELWGGKGVH